MVYKKFIKKDGKLYGPYLYHSVKKDGKVTTNYLGKHSEKKIVKGYNFSFIKNSQNRKLIVGILSIMLIVLLIYLVFVLQFGATGKASLDIQSVYAEGENLKGQVNLILKQGELFPTDSQVVIDNVGKVEQYLLDSLIYNEKVTGDFYVEGQNISGYGEGYGIPGNKEVFPQVLFSFRVVPSVSLDNDSTGNVSAGGGGGGTGGEGEFDVEIVVNDTPSEPITNETPIEPTINESASVNETPFEEPPQSPKEEATPDIPIQEPPVEEIIPTEETTSPPEPSEGSLTPSDSSSSESTEDSTSSETSSDSDSSSEGASITGEVTAGEVIEGIVSKNSPYEYILPEGVDVEVINGSHPVSFSIVDGKVIFTTDYSEMQQGFGQEFIGNERLIIPINLTELGILARNGVLTISFIYSDIELTSSSKEITVISNDTINNSLIEEIPLSIELNVTGNISDTISAIQFDAVLGQPVKWKVIVKPDKKGEFIVKLPKEAENIYLIVADETLLEDGQVSMINETGANAGNETQNSTGFGITGGAVTETTGNSDLNISSNESLNETIDSIKVESKERFKEVVFDAKFKEYSVEYETPAPYSIEEEIPKGERIKVIGPETVHYKDVLIFTNLSENLNVKNPGSVTIYWVEKDIFVPIQDIQDKNNNGVYDYIEFIAPELSNQTFEIIVITKAEHLDENKTFVSDIYEQVKELDGVWSETIPENHFVRVTFEQNLTSENDITIYPKIVNGTPRIEVYEFNGSDIIATFESLNSNEYNKVFLTGLAENHSQDTFDLRVLNGSVEFDHIIDPIVPITEFFEDCVSISEWTVNSWYVSNQWCEATNTNDEAMTYGPINLSDPKINYANLSIYLNNSGFEGFGQPISKQDFLYFDISNNSGVSWTNLITSGDSGFLKYYSKNISSFVKLTSNMYIRARCVTNTDDFCRWDNMSITSYKEDNPPSVTLVNPIDGFVNNSYPINVSFTCNVIDDIGIANVSLYTNTTGSWALNQTAQIFSPISDVTNHYSTVYLGNGIYRMTFQPDGTYGKDTFVWEANPDTNYGNDDLVIRNNFDSDPLLEFNLSQIIGGNITVIGANLTLVRISGGDMEAGVYRITQTWGESSVTWNTRPSRDSFLYDQKTISSSATSVIFNITNLVQEWVNGTYTNYGLFISYPGSGSSFVVSLNSSDTGDSTTRPKLVIDYKVKDQYSANFTINNIGQGSYIWNCRAFDTFPSSSFAPANYTFYVDPCLPPTDGDWNIAQNCIVSNRIITLARDKNIQINNPGSLSLINTTLIINGSSNGVSNIDVNNGGNISLASNSEIKSANTNKFGFNIWETAKISMANSTLRSALSFAIYGKINNFTGNYLNNSPINVYTSHNVIKSSTFEKSNLKLTAGESEDSTNNTVDGNNFVGSFLIVDSTTFSSYNNTIINNIFESSVSGTFGAIHVLSSYNLIKNNTINRATYGIRFSGISVVSNNNVINNLVANSTNAGILTPITGGAILDNLFYGNVLINNSKGISIVSSADDNNLFVDNVILNNTNNDIENTGNNNTFLNTTFNKSKVSVTGGYINVQWYLDVNVNDYGAGVNQANVTGANVSGQRAFSTLTNNQGNMTPRQNLTEYFRNSSHIVYHTNYTINVTTELSPPGTYLNNYSGQLNITNNTLLNVFLHRALQVDTCYPSSDKVNLRITQTVICNDTTIAAGSLNVTSTGNLTLINTTLIVGNTWVSAGGRLYINNSRNTIWQNGNLTIGGKYILQNSTLRMNGTSPNGAIGINVTSTGNMNITESSNITNGQDANYKYFFIVNTGSIFSMDNSYLSYAGWDEAPGAYGLQISTTVARFEGNTLKNNYIGVILYVSNNNIIKSNLIAGNLLTGIGILTGNNNTLILNNVTNNPYGIAMDAFAGNNYIISNNFSNNDNAIYISGSSNNLVTSSLLKDNPTGIFFAGVSSNNLIRDSNIINSSTRNIYTEGSGNNIFLNTSFNKSKVNFLAGATGKINVQWYLDVNVTDYYSGNVLSGVNVSAWNNTLLNPPVFTALTGVNGLIVPRQNITEYIQNITGIYPATNYTINATKTGYNNASKQLNITESTLLTMALIDSCLPHPTDNWNITQNCVVDSREITLARDKNLTISSGGSLTLINTTLWINGSNNGTSIISVLSGGSMNITDKNGDGSLINSTARNNRRFAFIVNYSSSFAMTNSQLEEAGWVEALGKYGLEIRTTVARFEGNTIKNNYVGVLLSSNHNTIKSNSIDGNLLVGISIFTGNINNTLILNNITNNWYGVSLTAFSSNNYIISNNISNNGNGISLESTNNIFRDSNITNSVSKDIEVFGSGYNTFLNTPFNKTKVFFDSVSTGKIDVKWYLDLTVKNISSHLLQGANVTAFNRTLLQVFSELSGASGQISRKNITEYTQNITGVYYRTNYTLNSSLTAYRNYSQQLNVTKSMQFDIVLLKNIPPTVTLISPVDNFTTNNRTPTFNWSGFDADSDPLTYELNLTCFSIIGGGCSDDNRVISVGSSTSHTLSDYLRYLYDNFYYYNWSVRASDDTGVTWGSWSEIRKLNIQSLVSISLTNNEVKFGSMFPGESNDTLDDSPLPFILENTGNSFVNVSINATNLWFTQQNPTEYFKYKIDNITSEKGSFDWGRTNTSWRQVPGWITPTIAIVHFNWTDATDSAEININVTVPGGIEGAGSRNSYIYFTASFDEKDGGGGGPQI